VGSVLSTIRSAANEAVVSERLSRFQGLAGADSILCFEHGCAGQWEPAKILCSTTHAHLHLVPLPCSVIAAVLDQLGHPEARVCQLHEATPIIDRLKEYLAVFVISTNEALQILLYAAASLPSQYMRRLIASELGQEGWNWKSSPNPDLVKATIALGFSTGR
jgi:hypothetical protein